MFTLILKFLNLIFFKSNYGVILQNKNCEIVKILFSPYSKYSARDGVTGRPDRVIEVRVPVNDQTGDCGISIVGGSDTPLRGVFVQSLMSESATARVGILKPGDRIVKLNGRSMDGLNHSEAVMIFSKLTQLVLSRDKREFPMTVVRQVGYETEENHTFVIRKEARQQVGVKLYNVTGELFL